MAPKIAQDTLTPPGARQSPSGAKIAQQAGIGPRALLVGAVSTSDRQQDPENQLRPLRANAARHGWMVAGELVFKQSRWDDESAREVRARILARVAEGDIDLVAVWGWDRVSRRGAEEAFAFLRELEQHHAVRFFSLQEPFLSTASSPELRELLLPIIAWNAKYESQRKSDRLVAKAVTKREASAKLGQRATWGGGQLASPAEVARVHQLRNEGASLRGIAAVVGLSKSQVDRILRGSVKSA